MAPELDSNPQPGLNISISRELSPVHFSLCRATYVAVPSYYTESDSNTEGKIQADSQLDAVCRKAVLRGDSVL